MTPVGFILKPDLQRYHVSCGGVIRIHKPTTYVKSMIKYLKEMCCQDMNIYLYIYIYYGGPRLFNKTIA